MFFTRKNAVFMRLLAFRKRLLTRRMKGAIIAKSLVRQSISTKKTKKSLKKVLDKYKMI